MGLSRRQFLTRVGAVGGYSAAFLTMQGLGLVPSVPAGAEGIHAAPGSGSGTRVVVLGGGIAGLVAAYELRALGYAPLVLEARSRPGGRNWTVRGGDTVQLTDGSSQSCGWGPGSYQNFGPARLPSIHRTILGYCRKLGVELQVEINMTRSAHLQNDAANGGHFATMRQVENDARGHVSELLMKSMSGGALDAEFSGDDRQKMMEFLRYYGPLDKAGKYTGSDRAGYSREPGAGDQTGVLSQPVDMHTLLDESFWQGVMFDEAFDMQATMFQPVGGMDRIPYAFAKSLGKIVQYDVPVTEIRKSADGVRVAYTQGGAAKVAEAAYCICALPLTILRGIPNDFDAAHKKVIDECTYASAYKIAWESRRFWEMDDNIYGGLEFVNHGPSPIWFPSAGLFSERGVAVAGYTDELEVQEFAKLPLAGKFAESRRSMERLHPGHGKELEKPMYVSWGKVEHNLGSWIHSYGPGQDREEMLRFNGQGAGKAPQALAPGQKPPTGQAPGLSVSRQTGQNKTPAAERTATNPGYQALLKPDDRIIFAGDHTSHIVGWQEGAALSAIRAVNLIAERERAAGA